MGCALCVYNEWPSVVRLDVVLYTRYFGDRFFTGCSSRATEKNSTCAGISQKRTQVIVANDTFYCCYLPFIYAGTYPKQWYTWQNTVIGGGGFNKIKKNV